MPQGEQCKQAVIRIYHTCGWEKLNADTNLNAGAAVILELNLKCQAM